MEIWNACGTERRQAVAINGKSNREAATKFLLTAGHGD
jgi:hypothetical protein